ncbi:MAG: MlaE family lipid ABC transporter permease subunit [Deltaproteobacteria bacterium]|nr:MlaE family lipid ABC transporter permease subunit [Deltaproteobacteria bacterium]
MAEVAVAGSFDRRNASACIAWIDRVLKKRKADMTVDLSGVISMDDYGILVLDALRRRATTREAFFLRNVPREIARQLEIVHFKQLGQSLSFRGEKVGGIFYRLGDASITIYRDTLRLLGFIGDVCLSLAFVIRHPGRIRYEETFTYMQRVGVDALPIVGLISFLLGLIMAFMSAVQLQQFGANIYVASLVSLSMVRELGPIMTAIIVAGRSGSAFAAEIGSMIISEEVDALTTMGFNTTVFLVIPKLLATLAVVPLLTLFSDLFAIFGGLIVGVGMLDLTAHSYIEQTIRTLKVFDVVWGFFKSAIFALLISWIGCFRGFQVRGGADAVGRATTSAVVSAIFLIILADSILAVILRYWR